MPAVYCLGPLFAQVSPYAARLVERGETVGLEPPYRVGRSVVVRAWPLRRALVVGVWVGCLPEEEAQRAAMGVRHLGALSAPQNYGLAERIAGGKPILGAPPAPVAAFSRARRALAAACPCG